MASRNDSGGGRRSSVVRRSYAMLPFCGYHMATIGRTGRMGAKLGDKAPKIFNVNLFRTDTKSLHLAGFGDNMRVLDWIIERAEGKADAVETAIGYEPKPEDINVEGLESEGITTETIKGLLNVDVDLWKEDVKGIKEFYAKFGDKLPEEMKKQLAALEKSLG